VQLLLTLLQFSTQIFQTLQNVCTSGPLQIWFFLQTCLKVPMVHQTVTTKVCI
jgi:hypothetical protein